MEMRPKKGLITTLVIFFILCASLACLAGEQGYLIVKDNETFLDSGPATPITWQNRIWITDNSVRIENDQDKDHILLIHMDKGIVYQLDMKNRTYKKMDKPEGIKDLEGKKEIESKKLAQTRKFGEWNCYGVKMNTKTKDISLDAEYWMTKEVDIPYALRRKVSKYFGFDQESLTEELAKFEGYPVYVTLTMKVKDKSVKMNTLVMEFKKLEIEPQLFEIPKDFKFVDISPTQPQSSKMYDPNMK